ncbi:MAG: ankyrin repeat domain-containing protein [Acidocella sp.]|nr:ankyrin repeat domain-containing protein [Acidocella sp.]
MTTLPSTEAILLEVLQSLGGTSFQTNKKQKFVTGEASLEKHIEIGQEVVTAIFDALELDDAARGSAARNFQAFANAYKALELDTWTFDADHRQVLWMLLGYFYIPGLARHIAWWTTDCRMDRHMPGGRFWYLPEPRERGGETSLYLPVAQVVDWLLDLLGIPLEKFADQRARATDEGHEGLRRTLYGWRKDTTPELSTLKKYFPDNAKLEFKGAFFVAEQSKPEEKFAAALAFVARKKLTANLLRDEIPMTAPGRLEAVLGGQASFEEQEHFVNLLADRYAVPSPHTIRQYLRIARAAQDGYDRLLEVLCPGVEPLCANPSNNKILQVFGLYKYVYNLTIDAWRNHSADGEGAENHWFEAQLAPQLACGPLLSIMPSVGKDGIFMLSQILNTHFEGVEAGSPLEDLLPVDEKADRDILVRNLSRKDAVTDVWTAAFELTKRLKAGGPWAKLQAETRFSIVAEIASSEDLSERILEASVARLHELAQAPAEKVRAIIAELHRHLNNERHFCTKESKDRVQALLDKAANSSVCETWKAIILQYKAKHLLAQNDFNGALKRFREAREICKERWFGRMRGEIARDCFALELADRRLIQGNHEPYFRDMLRGDIFPQGAIPTIEDAARYAFGYFWDTLYKPYPGIEARQPRSDEETRELGEQFLKFLIQEDRDGFVKWIQANKKRLAAPFPDVEGNSFLLFLIKSRTMMAPDLQRMRPGLLNIWTEFFGLLIQHGPLEQLNWPDFKAQTPLMLMAEEGETKLVRLLLISGADRDKQDYRGLSALHAAVKSRVSNCVDTLLGHDCRTDFLTVDKRSPLHTAVWSGNLHAVERLLHYAPELAWQRDAYEMTPLELAETLIDEPEALKELSDECSRSGATCATKKELEEIAAMLEKAPHKRTPNQEQ